MTTFFASNISSESHCILETKKVVKVLLYNEFAILIKINQFHFLMLHLSLILTDFIDIIFLFKFREKKQPGCGEQNDAQIIIKKNTTRGL